MSIRLESPGLAQIVSALSASYAGWNIPISVVYYALNIPLLILAWYKIGYKFSSLLLLRYRLVLSLSNLYHQLL